MPDGSSQDDGQKKNPVSDVQNLLGFLLVGFGAILSFLGLRSNEVTTVLRNDAPQASLIALMLLFGVLAAVLTVAIEESATKKVSWAAVLGVVLVLLGVGAFVIYLIPAGAAVGVLSLVLGIVLVSFGMIVFLISTVTPRKFLDVLGIVLAVLAAVAFIIHFIAAHKVTGLILVLGWVFAPLAAIMLIYSFVIPRIRKGPKEIRAKQKVARAEEKEGRADQKAAEAEIAETTAEVATATAEVATAGAEQAATRNEGVASAQQKRTIAQEKLARAQEKLARAQEKIVKAQQDSLALHCWYDWQPTPRVPLTVVFILTSVMFIAISAYGGMRLETGSQLSSSAQVAANLSVSGADTTVQAHVTAYKVKNGSYIGVTILGLPATVPISMCGQVHLGPNTATCQQDPCGPKRLVQKCVIVMNGTIAPDVNGDVDDTLSFPVQSGEYQDIDVRANICSPSSCQPINVLGAKQYIKTEGSRVDVIMPTPSPTLKHRSR